jgi:hypothetical protein
MGMKDASITDFPKPTWNFGRQRLSATKKETLKNSTAWHHWDGTASQYGNAN